MPGQKRTLRALVIPVLATLVLAGCAHSIHQVHASDFNPPSSLDGGRVVRGMAEQFTVMGIVGNTDYVDEAYRQLAASCKGGAITGITTQFSTSLGFFSWTNKVLMQGLCVKTKTAAR